ncbi:hypothetical protein GCM10010404_91320 [Nonomuraea africana]
MPETAVMVSASNTIRDLTCAISFSQYSDEHARQLWVEMTRRLEPGYVRQGAAGDRLRSGPDRRPASPVYRGRPQGK